MPWRTQARNFTAAAGHANAVEALHMKGVVYWFRSDLRLHDQPALAQAVALATAHQVPLLPVYCHAPDAVTQWGFTRIGPHRRAFLAAAVQGVAEQLNVRGSRLLQCVGLPQDLLPALVQQLSPGNSGAAPIVCEAIAVPQEEAEVKALLAKDLAVQTVWQSSLLHPDDLPFAAVDLPPVFTTFRQRVEQAKVQPRAPVPAPQHLPHPPPEFDAWSMEQGVQADRKSLQPFWTRNAASQLQHDPRSSFPSATPAFAGTESAALAHLAQYWKRGLAHSYKQTRNGLTGVDYSSKFSPWMATGALSPREAMAQLRRFEREYGANDGTYWLWFELLWRDYFRLLHCQNGRRLYRWRGLSEAFVSEPPAHDADAFDRWCTGQTGEPLVDAAMRELRATGYLSNRLRQVAASYWVHHLQGDWRAGAAWFERCLLDYDPYSNQGNWLYLAGRGTDPRGGRRFNPQKQALDHDRDGHYRRLWGTA